MSPSIVDLQSPASSSSLSSKFQSSLNISQSFVAGTIYSSPSHFIFRSSSIPDPSSSMDGSNLGQGVSGPSEKVCVSRFRKQRKRAGASRSVPSDGGAGPVFGSSRAETHCAIGFDRGGDSGTQFVQQKIHGWKPFESDALNSSSSGTGFAFGAGSSGSNASLSDIGVGIRGAEFDVGDQGRGDFGFGSKMEKDCGWESSSLLSTSTQNFCNVSSANFKSVRTGMPVSDLACSLGEGNVFSDEGVFVFGSSGNLCNSSSFGSGNDSFGALNSSKHVEEKSGKFESGLFVHRDEENKSKHASKNSSFASADGLLTQKPVRVSKKDQEIFGNVESQKAGSGLYVFGRSAETKFNLVQTSNICSNGSSFSSKLPEDLMKLKIDTYEVSENENKDPGVFVFRSGVNNSSCAKESTSFEFIDRTVSKLPQKMDKLSIHSSVGEDHGNTESNFKNHVQFGQTSFFGDDVGISMFPGELKKQNLHSSGDEEHGNDTLGVFIFGSDVKKNANSSKASTLNFEKSSFSKLPDEMKNMKLNGSGNEDDSQKSKTGHTWSKQGNNVASSFTSQSSKEDFGSKVTPLQTHNSCGLSAEPTSFPFASSNFQTSDNHLYFASMDTVSETPMEFRSQKEDASLLTKENLFTKPHENMIFSMKKEDSKAVRLKSRRGKSKKSTPIHTGTARQFVSVDNYPEENQGQDVTGGDSPMDYSPYQETLVTDQCSREMLVATAESIYFDSRCSPNDAQRSDFVDSKEGESAAEHFDCCFRVPSGRQFTSVDEMTSGLQKGSIETTNENVESVIQAKYSSVESESFNSVSSIKQPTYEGEFALNSFPPDAGQYNFCFTATSSVQDPSSALRRNYRKKSNIKGGKESQTKFKQPSPPSNVLPFPVPTDAKPEQKGGDLTIRAEQVNAVKSDQESAEEACEKWRLRGNHSYANGNLLKAEGYYSRGVDSLSFNEASRSCSKALMLCYSNRAAARMSLRRMREALNDCMMAVAIDPSFLRARVRAGNVHLSLGEFTDALQHFEKVLSLDKEKKSDQKILFEAADGIEKSQKLNDLMDQSSIFLAKRTIDDVTKALEIISEAFSIAPFSENLLEMKAEALVKLRNFDEAIQICEQTLEFAEKNAIVAKSDCQMKDSDCCKSMEIPHSRLWRWRIIAKSYFYLGKLDEANELLQKHEKVKPVIDKYWNRYPESSASFSVTVCELMRLKAAGNEAFQAGKHLEAVELYTAALALNTESRPFTAICFCNRAAAYQALGQVTDAIADCSLAIALDSNYKKAISRRATLHEMIRDHDQAANDLRRLISLLEISSEDKNSFSGGVLARSSSNIIELNQAQMRLSVVEEEARKVGTLDMYKILGIERSCSATDVKKAYRKAALRHHPDKAGQFLARSENGDDGVWREIAEEVHSDADRLFKMIGEAYAILVDPSKRLQYDTEEELKTKKKGYGPYSSPHERSSNPRQWSSYGTSRWKG